MIILHNLTRWFWELHTWDEQAGGGRLGGRRVGSQHQGALSRLDDRFPFPRQLHWLVFHPAPEEGTSSYPINDFILLNFIQIATVQFVGMYRI